MVPRHTPTPPSPTSSTIDRLNNLPPVPSYTPDESKRTQFHRKVIQHINAIKEMNAEQREIVIAKFSVRDQPLIRSLLRVADAGILVDAAVIDELDYEYQQLKRIADHEALFGESTTPSPTTPTSANSVESYISANGGGPSYRHVPRRPAHRINVETRGGYTFRADRRVYDDTMEVESAIPLPTTPSVESYISANGGGPNYRRVPKRPRRRSIAAPRGEFTFRVDRQMFDDMMVVGAELEPGDIGNRKRKVRSVGKAIKRPRTTVTPPVRKMKGAINSFRNYDTLRS